MQFWVGVTDNDWFSFLARLQPDEVNFWQPSGTPPFKRKDIEWFLFKLHSPYNYIVGGGYFITYINLPVSLAWETFEQKNGVASYLELQRKIQKYRESRPTSRAIDPKIGCSIITNTIFFPKEDWIPIPTDWASNIVRGKMYNTDSEVGYQLWDNVENKIRKLEVIKISDNNTVDNNTVMSDNNTVSGTKERYGSQFLAKSRLGQGSFRALVTNSYHKRCAFTGEKTLPVLEAAHIQSYAENGPHDVRNGLLLRADLHKLFDKNYITITPDYRIQVSSRIKEEYENGRGASHFGDK